MITTGIRAEITLQPADAALPCDLDHEATSAGSADRTYRLGEQGMAFWNDYSLPPAEDIAPMGIAKVHAGELCKVEAPTWQALLNVIGEHGCTVFPLHYAHALRLRYEIDQPYGSRYLLLTSPRLETVPFFSRRSELQLWAQPMKLTTRVNPGTELLVGIPAT